MRKLIIAGNWKLNHAEKEAVELVTALRSNLVDFDAVDVVVCPTFIALPVVHDVLQDSNIALGAQNAYWEDSGERACPRASANARHTCVSSCSDRNRRFS